MNLNNINKEIDNTNYIQLFEILLNEEYNIQISLGGFSMYPFIKSGDTVIVKKEKISLLKVGDIIVFKSNNKLIAHRAIFFKRNKQCSLIYSKGDAKVWFDNPIKEENYMGKIVEIIKYKKPFNAETTRYSILNKWFAFFSVFSIPFLILLIPFTMSFHFLKKQWFILKKIDF